MSTLSHTGGFPAAPMVGNTFKDDPISKFRLEHEDYLRIGEMIAAAGKPTLFVMEGGYAVEALGVNTVNVLTGFEQAAK